jgi:hypothetical protein
LENPKELSSKINELKNLRKEIFNSSIASYYKSNMLERIDDSLNYLNRIYQVLEKNKKSIVPIAIVSFLIGVGVGIMGKSKFDDYLEKYNKKFRESAIKELFEKLK